MDTGEQEIGAFEAKTRLAELLRRTEQGASFVIMRRGKPVARLVPVVEDGDQARREAAAGLRQLRNQLTGKFDVCRLVAQERKHR